MAGNANLGKAKEAKNDEFYTQLRDIELELKHYKEHFKGKTVLCNCDDPYESNFFKYFAMNFNYLGLKKLIATCYVTSPVMYTQLALFEDMQQTFEKPADPNKKPYKVEITEVTDENGDGAFDLDDIKQLLKSKKNVCTILKGDGDFSSDECIELLKEADIVVTNPPFSKFRQYIALLVKFNKKFIVIGNQNAITYKEIFPLIKDNKIWTGSQKGIISMYFEVPNSYIVPASARQACIRALGEEFCKDKNMTYMRTNCWYTNLDLKKRHEELILYKNYNPEEYPHYDNYDAIDVSKVSDIPYDYYGAMGVPITFLFSYNPDQFEIIGCPDYTGQYGSDDIGVRRIGEEWITKYRKQGGRGHYTANMTSLVYFDQAGNACNTFKRILIRRKDQPK